MVDTTLHPVPGFPAEVAAVFLEPIPLINFGEVHSRPENEVHDLIPDRAVRHPAHEAGTYMPSATKFEESQVVTRLPFCRDHIQFAVIFVVYRLHALSMVGESPIQAILKGFYSHGHDTPPKPSVQAIIETVFVNQDYWGAKSWD